MRARKKPWAQKELETNEYLLKAPEEYKNKWGSYFNNENPLHLEIGCGKGGFITKTAALNQQINYLALEREKQVIIFGMREAKNAGLKNLGFILGEVSGLTELFSEGDISRLYINFCDPWPNRKKWAKRRLTHEGFLNMYKRVLAPGSAVFFKTDNRELFEFSLNSFSDNGWRLKNISLDLSNSGLDNIKTEYEEKFSSMGMPIYRLEAYNII